MNSARFFVEPAVVNSNEVSLSGDVAHQIHRVLRLRAGQHVTLLDGQGNGYEVELTAIARDEVRGRVVNQRAISTEPRIHVTLYASLLKRDKFEWVLQKCTELGVGVFRPIISEHCVADEVSDQRLDRWRQIVCEAAEQSGRGIMPQVATPIEFTRAVQANTRPILSLLAHEQERQHTIHEYAQTHPDSLTIGLYIGPEGGFTELEVAAARQHGVKTISLGARILRAETASIVATTLVMHEWGALQ